MATKKQRRRRSKERRHEWEYVYIDDEGREVEVDEPDEPLARKPEKSVAKGTRRQPAGRGPRTVEPPSWRKAARRALLFGPFIFLFLYYTSNSKSVGVAAYTAIIFTAVLVPFGFLTDTMMYRMFRKRLDRGGAEPKRR